MEAGRIVNTHGLHGEVKIEPWCDSPEFLAGFSQLRVGTAVFDLERSRVHGGMLLAVLRGIDTVQAAQALKNAVVCIDRADVRPPEGRHFIADLLGLTVVDERCGPIGALEDVLQMPAQDVYVVAGEDGKRYIPVVDEFVLSVDMDEKIIRVRLIEGM